MLANPHEPVSAESGLRRTISRAKERGFSTRSIVSNATTTSADSSAKTDRLAVHNSYNRRSQQMAHT